jgi:dimethylhistidine N-methyltransferase
MSTVPEPQLSAFASDVLSGLTADGQKKLSPRYFYDHLGSKLFEAITLLPEYGLSRADERLLSCCANDVARRLGSFSLVAELGSGSGRKTSKILRAIHEPDLKYYPIDVSGEALEACATELSALAHTHPIHAEYFDGLAHLSRMRPAGKKLLLLFVGSSIGNFEPQERQEFFQRLHASLRPGDLFLLGADLVKDLNRMIQAYDDPTGVTAAFNLNLLGRMNRELDAEFDLRSFAHRAIWNARYQRIEMHLVSCKRQHVILRSLRARVEFDAGETIWTESSHKFTPGELHDAARQNGFEVLNNWTDSEWPFIETLWRA